MTQSIMQYSFAGGELAPQMWSRIDMAKYHSGAALMRNFFVDYRGGASTRAGTKFINQAKQSTVRLIPFTISANQAYVLELGNQYLRAYLNGAPVSDLTDTITGITQANPGVVTYTGTDPANGDWMVLASISGMTQLNGRTVVVTNVNTGAKTFQLYDTFGNPIDTTAYSAYVSGGTAKRIQTVTTPWLTAELFDIRYVQSADVMTLTHVNHAPQELTLNTTFSIAVITFGTTIASPTGLSLATTYDDMKHSYAYQVTAVDPRGQESLPSSIVAISSGLLDPTGNAGNPVIITATWTAEPAALYFNVYKDGPNAHGGANNSILGFIGQCTNPTTGFLDNNIAPDYGRTPPQNYNPFAGSNNPSCVTFFQQRRVFAGSASGPQTMWFSQPGYFYNYNQSLVVLDTDAITITIASREVNTIESMVAMPTGMMVFTASGAFLVSGQYPQAPITPATISALPQASNGANRMPPIVVNYDCLYVERTSNVVRDAAFNFYTQSYYGYDRSALAAHLFYQYSLQDWAYSAEPFRVIWCVRNDGKLLSFTYVPEQEVYAWAQHDTNGLFLSVCSVIESNVDAIYVAVQRLVNGTNYTYIERMAERNWIDVRDAWCVDCALNVSNSTLPNATLTIAAVTGNSVVFASDTPGTFNSGMVNSQIHQEGVAVGTAVITSYTDSQHVTCQIIEDFTNFYSDDDMTPYPLTSGNWSIYSPVKTVNGLYHLVGKTISGLVDGNVVSGLVVSASGSVTLPNTGYVIVLGLPFTAQLQTLYPAPDEGNIQSKRKLVPVVTSRVTATRGLKYGASFDSLVEYKAPFAGPQFPVQLMDGDQRIVIKGFWSRTTQICIEQDYPLPATVTGLILDIVEGDNAGAPSR